MADGQPQAVTTSLLGCAASASHARVTAKQETSESSTSARPRVTTFLVTRQRDTKEYVSPFFIQTSGGIFVDYLLLKYLTLDESPAYGLLPALAPLALQHAGVLAGSI